ncbi:hypothetical protein DRQ09_04970 [candidate division KSB1 bacterium]|nr:MAG: hypothetical protein DRQ09_04970 [candidate division KSB1 bacterium]
MKGICDNCGAERKLYWDKDEEEWICGECWNERKKGSSGLKFPGWNDDYSSYNPGFPGTPPGGKGW